MESGTDFFFPWIRKNQGPSSMPKKSGFEHLIYLPYFIVVIGYFQTTDLVPLIEVYIQEHQYFASVSVILVFHCGFYLLLCVYFPCPEWNQIRRAVIFIRAAVIIVMIYATLVVVNTRYISLVMVPIIMLVFIGALCRQVSLRGSLKQDDSGSSEAEIPGDGSAEKSDGNNCGSADKEEVMVAIALLPYCALIMGRFHFGNLVVSQFFLFLSSTVGVLTLMVAWLSCSHLAPALDVLRRASLVVVLLTGHTMAGELLSEDVVLVCTPEIVAALLWFTSHLQLGHGGTTVITVDKVTSPQSGVICLSVVMGILSYLARSIDESEGEDLLVRYRTAVIACAVSVILLSLCAFALRQWPGETKARPSSELEGAIRLFNFWRNVMSIAAALLLIVWPLVDVQLGLQVQRLSADSMGKFLDV